MGSQSLSVKVLDVGIQSPMNAERSLLEPLELPLPGGLSVPLDVPALDVPELVPLDVPLDAPELVPEPDVCDPLPPPPSSSGGGRSLMPMIALHPTADAAAARTSSDVLAKNGNRASIRSLHAERAPPRRDRPRAPPESRPSRIPTAP